jgi:hypothetical protein
MRTRWKRFGVTASSDCAPVPALASAFSLAKGCSERPPFLISNLQIYKNSHSATVRLVPINSQLKIELYGELAAMLSLGLGDKHKHPRSTDLGVQVTLVAGVGFEPTTFRL